MPIKTSIKAALVNLLENKIPDDISVQEQQALKTR